MLSGNGRHRRPRQAPALLVAAGVTGSAIAIPLLGATGASAATGTTWDHVAECESGGSWSENAGNGYYGGLQVSQDNWEKYGGLEYASSADEASRSQQIAVAEKMLDDQGITAWPTCGLLAGLSKDSDSADIDTGLGTGSPDSSDSSGSSGLSDSSESSSSSSSPSASPTPSGTSASADAGKDKKDKSAKSDTASGSNGDKSADSGTEKDGSDSSVSSSPRVSKQDEADNLKQSVGTSSLVDTGALGSGRHRGGSATEDAASGTTSSAGRHVAGEGDASPVDSYTVRLGDTLASIADSLGLDGGWRALYDANKDAIGIDPSSIAPGQTLRVGV
ncbi:LysM peptidoglycan-binding domain-containing protein [Streptomyces sp. NBC_00289]|uniref:transglycosylase family protein n=1 Tax=Streptomyces sp. NBC_00289 TaxID=2975703 RepID=UPI0032552F3B